MTARTILFFLASCVVADFAAAADLSRLVKFDIPAQSVQAALFKFSDQTNVQVVVSSEAVIDKKSSLVVGELPVQRGLETLLGGTDLQFTVINEHTVAIRSAEQAAGAGATELALAQEGAAVPGTEEDASAADRGGGTPARSSSERGAGDDASIAEIIVTAQKRSERLQDVPVPVTVVEVDSLANSNQLRLQDYYLRVPGLNVILGADNGAPRVAIRGVTTGGSTNPTVATVIDDIPFGPSTTSGNGQVAPDVDPSDLASIEVLRGPQGTLYGASSLGGLLKYMTVDPSTEGFNGRVQAGTTSVENGDGLGYSVRGAINVPLSDTFAFRASGFTRRDPGYIDNVQTGEEGINQADAAGGRLSALWRPSEMFSLKLSALYQDTTVDGASEVHLLPGLEDLQQSALRGSGGYSRKTQAYSATIIADVGRVKMTSLTGYSIFDFTSNLDAMPLASARNAANTAFGVTGVISAVGPIETAKFTQELRLSAPLNERIEALFGLFYTQEDNRIPQHIWAVNPATGARAGLLLDSLSDGSFEDYAAFANLTFNLTDRFDIQVGGRKSENRRTAGPDTSVGAWNTLFLLRPSQTSFTPQLVSKDDSFTYLLTPRFKVSPTLMVYARLASGYRPGGSNTAAAGALSLPPFTADTAQNYEIGVKGDAFDRALTFDASLYYIDWKDMQIQLRNAVLQAYFANAGRAKSQGVELSMESRPFAGLTVGAWAAYNEAELTEDFPFPPAGTPPAVGTSGDRLPYSSRFSGSLSLDQEFSLASSLTGFVGGSVSYVGDRLGVFRGLSAGVPLPRQTFPAYTQADLRVGVRHHSWSINAFVTNVADKRGVIRGGSESPLGLAYSFNYIQPRTTGLSFTKEF